MLTRFLFLLVLSAALSAEEPSLPTVDEIQKRALAFKFEPGEQGGTLHDWMTQEFTTWNLAMSTDSQTASILNNIVFEHLFESDPLTLKFRPMLAAAIPEKSDDEEGRVWTVKLREDVTWHDGKPFTADDVVFTFNDIYLNEKIAYPGRASIQMVVDGPDGKPQKRSLAVEKLDEFSVRFTLPRRHAQCLTQMNGLILPRHALEGRVRDGTFETAWGPDTPPKEVVGTGPFMPSELVKGSRVVLKRNPAFRDKDETGHSLPYLEKVEFRYLPDVDEQLKRFLAGDLDYVEPRMGDVDRLLSAEAAGKCKVVSLGPRAGVSYIALNQNPRSRPDGTRYVEAHKSAWFRDVRFRRAIAHAIDRKRILHEWYFDRGISLSGPYNPKFPEYYTDAVRKYEFDLAKSASLLDEMGLKDRDGDGVREDAAGHPVEFHLLVTERVASQSGETGRLSKDLASIGVKMRVLELPFNQLLERISKDWDWEGILLGSSCNSEPLWGKAVWKTGEARRIWNPKADPLGEETRPWERRLDEIFDEAYTHWNPDAHQFDHAKDVELAREWQQICAENLPQIPLFSSMSIYAFSNRLGNVRTTLYSLYDLERIYIRK